MKDTDRQNCIRRSLLNDAELHDLRLTFNNVINMKGTLIKKPKALGDIRGVSYIYPILYEFGIIDVPGQVAVLMKMG